MAGKRTPLKNTRSAGGAEEFDDSVTETSFGSDDDDDDDEEMTEAERRKARGDAVDDDDDDDGEEADDDESDEEEDGDDDEEGDDEEEEEDEEEEDEGDDEADDEEEDEEEGEEPLDAEALAAIAGGKTPKSIPYSRFQQVVAQNQQLIDALTSGRGAGAASAQTKEETPAPPPFDFKAKSKEYRNALLDGDDEKAEALEAEIDAAKAEKIKTDLLDAVRQEQAQDRARAEAATVQQVIGGVMKDYPIFNDASGDDFDQEALDELIGLRDTYIKKGMPVAEAIRKAADRVAQLNGYEVKGAAKPAKGNGKKVGKKASVAGEDNRSVRDKRRALSNARRTPPNLGRNGTGNRAVPSMQDYGENGPSEAQIRRMSDKEKAIARGDIVVRKKK